MEIKGSLEDELTHMSCVKATVTDILSDRLGILTAVSSKERILFDTENLYVAGVRCDPFHALSSYVTVSTTEWQCDASLLQQNNEWNTRYEATCVWRCVKPSLIKIFGHCMSNCSCAVAMAPGRVYKGRIAKVSPPDVALAIATVSDVSVPVLIFLNNLYENCDLRALSNSEWIQDHLRADDVVEFEIEKRQRRSAHRKYNVAIFAWKIEWNMRQSNSSCCSKAKRPSSGNVDDEPVSNAGVSEVTSNTVSHVGTSDVESCTAPDIAQTEIQVEYDIDKNKCAFMCEASEPSSDGHPPLHGASEQLMDWKCHMSPSEDAGFADASLDNSQESIIKAVASDSREYPRHDTAHTVAHELMPHEHHGGVGPSDIPERDVGVGPSDIPEGHVGVGPSDIPEHIEVGPSDIPERHVGVGPSDIPEQDVRVGPSDIPERDGVGPSDIPDRDVGVGPSDIPERDVGEMSEHQRTCKPRCGAYSGRIYSFGHNHGTIAFTMDGREERALFYSLKVYINGIKTRKKCKVRNILQSGMLVTLDVMQYEGETFKYKATGVYIEGFQVAGTLTASSGEEAVSNESRTSCYKSLEKIDSPVEDEMYRRQVTHRDRWHSLSVSHTCDCICRTCPIASAESHGDLAIRMHTFPRQETSVSNTESHENLAMGVLAFPRQEASVANTESLEDLAIGMLAFPRQEASVANTKSFEDLAIGMLTFPRQEVSVANTESHEDLAMGMFPFLRQEASVANTESRENLAMGMLAFPRQEVSVAKNVATGRQETVGSTRLPEEEPTTVLPSDTIVLESEVKMSVPRDDQEEEKVPESCAGIDCFVPQTQKAAELNSSVQEESTNETSNASHCIIPLDLLPESARNVPGVIDASWANSMVLMTATLCKLKVRVIINGRDLYVDKKYIVMNTDWQHRVQGMKVCADVTVLRDHPSGAVYVATCAWKGKHPGNMEQLRKRESNAGTCPKNRAGNNTNSVIARSKVDLQCKGNIEGRHKSESCDSLNIKYPAKDKGTNKQKLMHVDRSCCVQKGVETNEEKMRKTLRSEEFVGTVRVSAQGFECGAETDSDKCKGVDISDLLDEVKHLCRDEVTGDAHVSDSSSRDEIVQLPVVPVPHTGLSSQIRGKLARVKRYESSTRGVLEYTVCGAELEVIFHKSVVNFCGNSETTDLEEYLPVGSEVYFEGEMLGENKLLGCSDIIVTSVQETRGQRKQVSSKRAHSRTFRLVSPVHEGLLQGRVYEGIVSQIRPPFAFVAVVEDSGKTYDVFVLNRFFSPVEYGTRLPAKHPVVPYVAEGTKVHVMVSSRKEANSKLTHKWFAVDAWTEEQNNTFPGTHRGLNTERNEEHLEGVIMRVFPAWGLLQVDHLTDAVMFFRQDTFLFGVRLAVLDLEQVLPVGKSHSVSGNLSWIRARSRLVCGREYSCHCTQLPVMWKACAWKGLASTLS
jgi:hypothetical protein